MKSMLPFYPSVVRLPWELSNPLLAPQINGDFGPTRANETFSKLKRKVSGKLPRRLQEKTPGLTRPAIVCVAGKSAPASYPDAWEHSHFCKTDDDLFEHMVAGCVRVKVAVPILQVRRVVWKSSRGVAGRSARLVGRT